MTQTFYLYLASLVSKVNNLFDYQDLFNCATMDKRYQFTKTDFDVFWEKTLASGTKLNGGAFPEYNLDFSIVKNTIETAITENTIYETLKTVYGYSDDILRKKLLKNPAKYTDNDAEDWTGKLCDMYLDAKPKMLKFIQKNPKNSYEKNMAKVVKKQIIANFSDYR